jgi:hypothetical protein
MFMEAIIAINKIFVKSGMAIVDMSYNFPSQISTGIEQPMIIQPIFKTIKGRPWVLYIPDLCL